MIGCLGVGCSIYVGDCLSLLVWFVVWRCLFLLCVWFGFSVCLCGMICCFACLACRLATGVGLLCLRWCLVLCWVALFAVQAFCFRVALWVCA